MFPPKLEIENYSKSKLESEIEDPQDFDANEEDTE